MQLAILGRVEATTSNYKIHYNLHLFRFFHLFQPLPPLFSPPKRLSHSPLPIVHRGGSPAAAPWVLPGSRRAATSVGLRPAAVSVGFAWLGFRCFFFFWGGEAESKVKVFVGWLGSFASCLSLFFFILPIGFGKFCFSLFLMNV